MLFVFIVSPRDIWKDVHGLIFDQLLKIVGSYVTRIRKLANRATKQRQAEDQAADSGQVILFEYEMKQQQTQDQAARALFTEII